MSITIRPLVSLNAIATSALAYSLVMAGSAFAQQPPVAASTDTNIPDEIIVTATRRESGSQSVPLALTAIGGDKLREVGLSNAANLTQLAPSLVVNTDVSAGSPRYSLRGLSGGDVTPTAAPAIATYIDDVPQAAQYGIGASLFDLQRVEVLRGPQGTTFGKNTTGGAIAYFAQTPTNREEGYVSGRLGGGDRGEYYLEGAVNVPIVNDKLAARISFRAEQQNDWTRDNGPSGGMRGGGTIYSGRGQLRWTPDENTYANLTVYLSQRRGDQAMSRADFAAPNQFPSADPRAVSYSPGQRYDNFDNRAVTLRIGHKFGEFDLTSITHYRYTKQNISQDLAGVGQDLFLYRSDSRAEQYGQEIRLASDATRPLSGLFGLYFEHDRLNEQATEASTTYGVAPGVPGPFRYFFDPDDFTQFGGANGPRNAGDPINIYDYNNPGYYNTTTNTYAVFGNLTYKVTSALSVTVGARKTIENKKYIGQEYYYIFGGTDWSEGNLFFDPSRPPATPDYALSFVNTVKDRPVTWDVTVDYNPTRNLLFFARVAKGIRSGGFNQPAGAFVYSPFFDPGSIIGGTGRPSLGAPLTFGGEKVQSYELGVKATPAHWLRVNATAFHYDFTDQQVTTFPNGLLSTTNAGTSKVDGAEVEVSLYPTRGLDLSGSLSYTNARYTNFIYANPDPNSPVRFFDLAGNKLSQAPRWSANWSANYRIPVSDVYTVRLGTTWTYRSQIFFTQENTKNLSDPERFLGNARIAFEPSGGKGFSIAAYVNNVTNRRPLTLGYASPAPYNVTYFAPGRTFGLDASYRW